VSIEMRLCYVQQPGSLAPLRYTLFALCLLEQWQPVDTVHVLAGVCRGFEGAWTLQPRGREAQQTCRHVLDFSIIVVLCSSVSSATNISVCFSCSLLFRSPLCH